MRGRGFSVAQGVLAAAVAICGAVSFFATPMATLAPLSRHSVALHFFEGRIRVFWVQSHALPVEMELIGVGPDILVRSQSVPWPRLPRRMVGVDVPRAEDWERRISIGGFRSVKSFGGAWRAPFGAAMFHASPGVMSYVRLPVWLVCALLLYRPILAVIVGVRERTRRRNNLCLNCGYHLKGLIEPRCPECGTTAKLPIEG